MATNKTVRKPQIKEDIKANLEEIRKRLKDYKAAQAIKRHVNAYSAIGVNAQEIRHSAFLAWLFRSDESHGFREEALKLFFKKIIEYKYKGIVPPDVDYKDNAAILAGCNIDIDNIYSFFSGDNSVETEKTYTDIKVKNCHIDIFIKIEATKTVIVIENKIFSNVHSNQLKRYEQELDKQKNGVADYNKIFVFLTPDGMLPYNLGAGGDEAYNNKWCIIDYDAVSEICSELINELPSSQEGKKVKSILEDYKEIVDINVLKKDSDVSKLVRELIREFPTETELLRRYTDNITEVLSYCKIRLIKEMPEIEKTIKSSAKSFTFYTPAMKTHFDRNGETIKHSLCRWYFGSDGAIVSCVLCDKPENGWSAAQKKLVGTSDGKQSRSNSTTLLSWEEREKPFNEIKKTLDEALDEAIKLLKGFDDKMDK